MKTTYGIDELRSALDSSDALGRVIDESEGYALVLLRRAGLMPSKDLLMQVVCPNSLGFLIDHYDLTRDEKRQIAPMFNKSMGNAKLAGKATAENDLDEALQSKEALPEGTTLSYRQLLEEPVMVIEQSNLDEYESQKIVNRSFEGLTAEQILRLDRELLACYLPVFNHRADLFADSRIKALYKELALEGPVPRRGLLDDFSKWPFEKEDEPFLWHLLESQGDWGKKSFADCVSIPGFSALIDKVEFFKRVDQKDAAIFTSDELVEHKAMIQEAWLDAVKKDDRYARLSGLIRMKIGVDDFPLVVDKDFISRLASDGVEFDFDSIYMDDSDSKRKIARMKLTALDWALDCEGEVPAKFSRRFDGLSRLVRDVSEYREYSSGSGINEKVEAVCAKALTTLLPKQLSNSDPRLAHTIESGGEDWLSQKIFAATAEALGARPSINGLCMVLAEWSKCKASNSWEQKRKVEHLETLAKSMAKHLDAKSSWKAMGAMGLSVTFVEMVKLALGKAKTMARPWRGAPSQTPAFQKASKAASVINSSPERDVFKLDLFEANPAMMKLLARLDNDFASRMLKAGLVPSEDLMAGLLWGSDSKSLATAKKLIENHRKTVEAMPKAMEMLVGHERGEWLWGSPLGESLEDTAKKLSAIAQECSERLNALDKPKRSKGKEKDKARSKAIEEVVSDRRSRMEVECKKLSHSRLEELVDRSIELGDCALLEALSGAIRSGWVEERMAKGISSWKTSRFERMLDGNPSFQRMLVSMVSYDQKTKLELDFGELAANRRIAEKLLDCFAGHRDPDSSRDELKPLAMFTPEACSSFSNELALDRFPHLVPYSYRLAPSKRQAKGESYRYLVERPYSNEQMLRLFDKLDGSCGFFCDTDVNARLGSFFHSNYNERKQDWLGMLELSKSRPKLYCMLMSVDFENFDRDEKKMREAAESDEPRRGKSYARMMIAKDLFDWDVVKQGVGQIGDEMRRRAGSSNFNRKLAGSALDAVMWCTYADDLNDASGNTIYDSELPEEVSIGLVGQMANKAPLYLYSRHVVGSLDVPVFLERHFGRVASDDALEIFASPWMAHQAEYYSLGGNGPNRFEEYAKKILSGMLSWMIDERRDDDILRLDWMLRQRDFKQNELSWECKSPRATGKEIAASDERFSGLMELMGSTPELMEQLRVGMERLEIKSELGSNEQRRKRAMRL